MTQELQGLLAGATPGEWQIQDGCSWRRIGTAFHDGDVLCPTNSRTDGHPDLVADDGKLYANLKLIVAAVNALPELLASLTAKDAEIAALTEALTPSGDTKAEYIGEFSFPVCHLDEDGEEVWHPTPVPWDTIKEIMAAISARAARALHENPELKA